MPSRIELVEEEKLRERRNKHFAMASAFNEQIHLELEELKNSGKYMKGELEERTDKLSPHISNFFIPPVQQKWEATKKPTTPGIKEIASVATQIFPHDKPAKPTFQPPVAQVEGAEAEPAVTPAESLEEGAPVEDAAPEETAQRKNLWEMWESAAEELSIDLQDVLSDPFESKAAQKVMLLCSHLASQMNHETARSLLEFIEEYRLQQLKDAYKPGWKEWTPIAVQLLGALVGGFCGFVPAITGKIGSAAQGWEKASQFCSNFLVNGASSLGQLNGSVNHGKQAVVGHELESDKRLQQDLQQRRQQAEQAAKREFENITRMAQQKHDTIRSINS